MRLEQPSARMSAGLELKFSGSERRAVPVVRYSRRMKAIRCFEYGPPEVLRFVEIDRPVPKRGEVLVRVRATTVSAEDPKMRAFEHPPLLGFPIALLYGYPRPRRGIWGMELAGDVVALGQGVTRFCLGERVFGYTGVGLGAHAEYCCLPEAGIVARIPARMSYAEAAAVPNGALSALAYLRNMGGLRAGEKVLVYGASGAVGTAAVQLGKALGARVTAVCSTRNIELVEALGADEVVDYTKQDFVRSGVRYDIIFDTVGRTTLKRVRAALAPRGRYLITVFGFVDLLRMLWTRLRGGQRIIGGASNFHWQPDDLQLLCDLVEQGKWTSVIDRTYPWQEAASAHRYVEQGHKRGNVVLLVGEAGDHDQLDVPA